MPEVAAGLAWQDARISNKELAARIGLAPSTCLSRVRGLEKQGIISPFPIQTLTIQDALQGEDVCGKAKTGSGKTVAFGLAREDLQEEFSEYLRHMVTLQRAAQ